MQDEKMQAVLLMESNTGKYTDESNMFLVTV